MKGPLPSSNDWALSRSGVYYVTLSATPGTAHSLTGTIHFLDFGSGQTTELVRRTGIRELGSMAVSPNEEWILYQESLPTEVDLVLVDNFR